MEKLNGKVAIVTGGSAGIGFATAKELVAQGAKVIITGRNQVSLDKAIAELGDNAHSFKADASSVQNTIALVDFVKSLYNTVDILLVNAGGVTELQPIGTIQEETFDIVTNLNFKGAVFTTEKFVPILADGASVIHMSSVAAFAFNQGNAVYASSKAALIAYSKVAAMELADRKIRVNVIAPAMTETTAIHKGAFESPELHDFIKEKFMPFKRYGTPEEVAKLVSFLASDDASFISGSVITIDSGASINSVKL